eukprot:730926-Pleurochrysis_carterae.AAC.1
MRVHVDASPHGISSHGSATANPSRGRAPASQRERGCRSSRASPRLLAQRVAERLSPVRAREREQTRKRGSEREQGTARERAIRVEKDTPTSPTHSWRRNRRRRRRKRGQEGRAGE